MSKLAKYASDRKWVWVILIVWIAVAGALSAAPSANDYTVNTGEDDLPKQAQSVIANEKVKNYFSQEGILALLVFHEEEGWNESNISQVENVSKWLTDETELVTIESMVPFHDFPDHAKQLFQSDDGTTLVLPLTLTDRLEMSEINDTISAIQAFGDEELEYGSLMITGPAGIASDTIAIFSNADLVLLFSTIGLVLVLLIVIYRSPLLAIIPLVAVAFVYQVVDRVLGIFAANGVFMIESQSLSIVMILLFGATTDYSLFVFSRYREELRKYECKHHAMKEAVKEVASPIFFSGGTVFAAMLVLFLADYGPYQNFAPVFAITIAIVLLAGLTLIPALFTIVGRRSFWPAIPQVGEKTIEKNRFWGKIGSVVTKKPLVAGGLVLLFLIINGLNVFNIQYSFNLIKSFPDDMTSRVGFEQLERSFPAGDLAPITVLVEKEEGFTFSEKEWIALEKLNDQLLAEEGIQSTSLPDLDLIANGEGHGGSRWLADSGQAVKFDLILGMNPYDQEALDQLDSLTSNKERLLDESGLGSHQTNLYFAGETAKQADIRALNERDTRTVVIVVTLVIFFMLIFHTRSLIAPVYMMATILISYLSALGLSWFIFENMFGYEAMSYRIPLYAFVFLVALGVDYNIMLISRIREENRQFTIRESVKRGVALTGGVISSAGIILAATFGVLMTQPILELFMFGFIVSIGILMDAFLVRGMLVPAIVTLLDRWNWWPFASRKSNN
ncbi:MMPL family transporter [Alkalihalobacterium chitinilyticum]|uniref:MMPL family transporter n=1 Tax=Alkalihalobacterium chitinilyticum TaxID=2980103 RepID=A0ABT5VE38_9BACI|nr:MMPL family transporter [Alkalihalobacterium chitinilyticum]MDE5413401.1 MMPL family transporter [Alkalihalobacterium chitinilyticum]